jgi:hypothetical protein
MKPEGSLLRSQEPATGPYLEPDESTQQSDTVFLLDQFVGVLDALA